MIELNIEGLGNERKLYSLGARNYIVETTHSVVSGWTLSVYDTEENLLVGGLSIIAEDRNLTYKYHSRLDGVLFSGDLWVLSKQEIRYPLTFDNFGESGNWGVYYLTQEESKEMTE